MGGDASGAGAAAPAARAPAPAGVAPAPAARAPTPAGVAPAPAKPLRDVGGPGLAVLFCGINPSLRSAEVGHHFARPGNRFWPVLHLAGFTPRRLRPEEDGSLPALGVGVTNLCARPTRQASELSREELRAGARELEALVARWQPGLVAIVGITAYRHAFARPAAQLGPQPERLAGRPLWALPNPSGLNAHHQLPDLVDWYAAARRAASVPGASGTRPGSSAVRAADS